MSGQRTAVRRAVLSVSNTTGLVDLARRLIAEGVELIASGGTAAVLVEAGLEVIPVADVTGSPEILSGRVKTLHPAVHGGILADSARPEHLADLEAHGIGLIDLVVVNLYPFAETVARPEVGHDEAVEQIDIGGVALIRAAAKNHARVGVVVSPDDYGEVATAVEQGGLDDDLRRRLAKRAFFHTARYDGAILTWLERGERNAGDHGPAVGEVRQPPLRREPSPGGRPSTGSQVPSPGGDRPGCCRARRCRSTTTPMPVRRGGWYGSSPIRLP